MKLEGKKLPGITKINRVLGIEEMQTKSYGKIYLMKYFLSIKKDNIPRMVALVGKNKSINPLFGIMTYDAALTPIGLIEIKPNMKEDDILKFIGLLISTSKNKVIGKKPVTEQYIKNIINEQNEFLNEEIDANILDDILKPKVNIRSMLKALFKENPLIAAYVSIMAIIFFIPVIFKFIFLIKTVKNWLTERYVLGPAEQKINDSLFKGQKSDEPAFAMFDTLKQYINHIINKRGHALIICGPPGMSKTYTVRRTLYFAGLKPAKDYSIEKGATLGLAATYDLLYKNRKRLLVLDDFDTPLSNPDTVNLLKSITDTYEKRLLSLPKEKIMSAAGKVERSESPDKFEYKGQLIIITNLTKDKIEPALLSRAPAFEVKYDGKEIIKALDDLLVYVNPSVSMDIKQEVYDYIMLLYKNDPKINITFRAVKSAIDARTGAPHAWKEMTKVIVGYKGKNVVESYLRNLNSNLYM